MMLEDGTSLVGTFAARQASNLSDGYTVRALEYVGSKNALQRCLHVEYLAECIYYVLVQFTFSMRQAKL